MDNLGVTFGLLAGVALIAAMIPHQVRLIRILCLVAGVCATLSLALSIGLTVALILPLAFTLINAARLFELIKRARSGAMTSDERELFEHVMRIEEPSQQSRLRDLMSWADIGAGERLIEQGQVNPPLIYIASGRAAIERDGTTLSECGAGEFLGEMSHISGGRASASVTVTQNMRIARMDRDALAQLALGLPEIGKALDSAFNRSLAVKVLRMNQSNKAD